MNSELYSRLYAKMHGSSYISVDSEHFMSIQLHSLYNMHDAVLKIQGLENVDRACAKALIRSLQAFLNVKSIVTVFYNRATWAALLDNKVLVYPQENGDISLTASPYFVTDVTAFHEEMLNTHKAVQSSDGVYILGGAVVYLDDEDVIFPGGNYFQQQQTQGEHRVCFITRANEQIPEKVLSNKYIVTQIPFKMRAAEVAPFQAYPQPVPAPKEYQTTDTVIHKHSQRKPANVVLDILESYNRPVTDLGLLVEAPIRVGFPGQEYSFFGPASRNFYAIAVNCVSPVKVLYVPAPYDRYYLYEYHHQLNGYDWTTVLYENAPLPLSVSRVVWGGDIVGYVYKDAFFCLQYPMLTALSGFKNADQIFNEVVEFPDDNVTINNEYDLPNGKRLFYVKHKQLPYDLWCIGDKQRQKSEFFTPKRPQLTPLVDKWVSLAMAVDASAAASTPGMDLVKIMTTLTRHNICYRMVEGKPPRLMPDLTFKVTPEMMEYMNQFRFKYKDGGELEKEEGEKKDAICAIM